MAYTKPPKVKERKNRTAKRREIKPIDLGFETWQVLRFRKARGRQDAP